MKLPKLDITNFFIVVVVSVWAVSVVLGMVDHTYQIPSSVQASMGGVGAFLLGGKYTGIFGKDKQP